MKDDDNKEFPIIGMREGEDDAPQQNTSPGIEIWDGVAAKGTIMDYALGVPMYDEEEKRDVPTRVMTIQVVIKASERALFQAMEDADGCVSLLIQPLAERPKMVTMEP